MTYSIELEHPTQVVRSAAPVSGLRIYRAECGCGWVSEWTADDADAEDAGVDHSEVMANPADDVDRVINELLDIQDDLAQLVVWLADNWTTDLPAPQIYGSRPGRPARPLVEVIVPCGHDTALVERIAQVLDRPALTSDASFLGVGVRRHFGTALIEAYAHPLTGNGRSDR